MAYRRAEFTVCCVLCPFSFSSLLIRSVAAERPMKAAKKGSATFEIRLTGEGILNWLSCMGIYCGWSGFGFRAVVDSKFVVCRLLSLCGSLKYPLYTNSHMIQIKLQRIAFALSEVCGKMFKNMYICHSSTIALSYTIVLFTQAKYKI